MAKRYARDGHRPDGVWVQATEQKEVVGVQFRKQAAQDFAATAKVAERKGLQYGLQLEHQPNNEHDSNAIAVYGVAEQKGWFKKTVGEWHIGYMDSETAAEIVEEFVSKKIPIAAQLRSIFEGDNGYLGFDLVVLAPKGHSLKSRRRRTNKNS